MSVCTVCSGDIARLVAARSLATSEISRRVLAPCFDFQVLSAWSRSPSSLCIGIVPERRLCSMIAAPRSGSSVTAVVGLVNVKTVKASRFEFGRAVSSISLSRNGSLSSRENVSAKQYSKTVARLSDVAQTSAATESRRLSDTFREDASDATEMYTRGTTSSSTSSLPSPTGGGMPVNLAAGAGITAAVFMMAFLGFVAKPRTGGGGSVSDLIRRGQLRSDRGSAGSTNLTFDDPFDNPLVRKGKKNPVVRMCGKLFRLAPVTITDEKIARHQKRRIQAYRWKRPTVFLNEGDSVPSGVDPDEVRWIPSNHPFATTANFIDEESAQKNIYQTQGVPSRVRAEHEALRKKILETAQREPEFNLPNLEDSGAGAWKIPDGPPTGSGKLTDNYEEGSDPSRGYGNQVQGNAGGDNRLRNGQSGSRSGVSEPRHRSIDFSGEEQGLGRN